jgi:hypothetical protein
MMGIITALVVLLSWGLLVAIVAGLALLIAGAWDDAD